MFIKKKCYKVLIMKNIIKLFLVLTVSAFTFSCNEKIEVQDTADPVLSYYKLAGTWKLVEWNGVSYDDSMPYVYITLDSKEQTFKLYSNMDSYYPVLRTGNFDMDYDNDLQYNILTGYYDYSFGFFQYDYRVLLQDNDTMIWIAIGAEDKCIYTRTDLPEGLE